MWSRDTIVGSRPAETAHKLCIVGALGTIVYKFISFYAGPSLQSTDGTSSARKVLRREKERGALTSLVGMLTLGFYNMHLDAIWSR